MCARTTLRAIVLLSMFLRTRTAIGAAWDDLYPEDAAGVGAPAAGLGSACGNHVIQTADEMGTALQRYNETGLFLEFFLPWCGHSRRLRPEFRRAAAVMAGRPVFARVDCSTQEGARVCLQFDVQYHPHMALVVGGKTYEYTQRATATEMCRYARQMLGEHVSAVPTLSALVDLLEDAQVLVAAVVEDEGAMPALFSEAARLLKDKVRFVWLPGVVFAETLGFARADAPQLLILRKMQKSLVWDGGQGGDEGAADGGTGFGSAERFAKWVSSHLHKLVESLTQENFQKTMGGNVPALLLFRDDSRASDAALKALYKTAAHFRDSLKVCSVNGARYHKLAIKLGVQPYSLPGLVLVQVANESHFVYPATLPIAEDEVFGFTQRVMAGQEAATLRSAPPPLLEHGPVYTLVADRFRLSALDPAKDVVVNFHARWCGFCNLFAPVYEQLARTMSHVHTLAFYEFDCSDNDPDPTLNVTSFPTIILFAAHNKSALTYTGDRSVPLLARFIQQHAGHEIETLPDGVLTDAATAQRIHSAIDTVRHSITHQP